MITKIFNLILLGMIIPVVLLDLIIFIKGNFNCKTSCNTINIIFSLNLVFNCFILIGIVMLLYHMNENKKKNKKISRMGNIVISLMLFVLVILTSYLSLFALTFSCNSSYYIFDTIITCNGIIAIPIISFIYYLIMVCISIKAFHNIHIHQRIIENSETGVLNFEYMAYNK
jgi:hypothetical protein